MLPQLRGGLASYLSQSHLESLNKDRCLDALRAWLDKLEMIYGFGGGAGGEVQIQRQTAACADMALCSLTLNALMPHKEQDHSVTIERVSRKS